MDNFILNRGFIAGDELDEIRQDDGLGYSRK